MKKTMAHEYIDMAASEARSKYITVGAGQESTYLLKAQHAKEYKAAGYTGTIPLLVQAEMNATGEEAQVCADSIIFQELQWIYLAGSIETIRRSGKIAISALTDPEEIANKCEEVVNTLHQI